jgi:hypothetical protein
MQIIFHRAHRAAVHDLAGHRHDARGQHGVDRFGGGVHRVVNRHHRRLRGRLDEQ